MINDDTRFCHEMLPLVSRTFAACIGLLPPRLSYEVLISYLLCRIADTIEDHPQLPSQRKHELLQHFVACLENNDGDMAAVAAVFAEHPAEDADGRLVHQSQRVLQEFHALDPRAQAAIAPWVREMCQGMAAFSADPRVQEQSQGVSALPTVDDLDRYCYYVAGTVGHLLTDLFPLHHHRLTKGHYRRLKSLATSFGLGLQLTNIIKDVADDSRRGWSFVPRQLCAEHHISPEHFLDPQHRPAAEAVMRQLMDKAQGHLDDALAYCLALPRSAYRMRLFCLTPMYFALRTLARARRDQRLLDPDHKVKISRVEVHRILRTAAIVAPNNTLVRGYYRRLAGGYRCYGDSRAAGAI